MEDRRGAYRVWWRNLREREPLGRPRHRWDDNIKMDFRKWDRDMDWIDLA